LLSTSYKILSNILFLRLCTYVDEMIRDHQCGFGCNRTTSKRIFCICEILEIEWEFDQYISYSQESI
jgi:hypothetical protein